MKLVRESELLWHCGSRNQQKKSCSRSVSRDEKQKGDLNRIYDVFIGSGSRWKEKETRLPYKTEIMTYLNKNFNFFLK